MRAKTDKYGRQIKACPDCGETLPMFLGEIGWGTKDEPLKFFDSTPLMLCWMDRQRRNSGPDLNWGEVLKPRQKFEWQKRETRQARKDQLELEKGLINAKREIRLAKAARTGATRRIRG